MTIECEIPQKHHRSVLGAKGANVQQIGSDFGVNIKFPERTGGGGGGGATSDVIFVTGKKEKAEEAKDALLVNN